MSNPESDEELAARAQKGDRAAFNVLVTRHHKRIFAFHRSSGNATQDAEDYTQETFLRVFKSIARYDSSQCFLPWLYTIARREAIRAWRKKKPAEPLPPAESLVDVEGDRHLGPHLWHLARLHLKPVAFTALWLQYREDLPLGEIACSIQKSESATKVLLHRARATLREKIDPAELIPQTQLHPESISP
ncbi:RNA polymerase sigma factor [Roseibacillus persicicus]|uniref:RNA polymerase sigma factor n=1 Tax=Roseibacillus persicicus TaxID=454148 RepID=UPI00398ADEBB